MKNSRIALTLFVMTISFTSFAQLNPIKSLYWHHWYDMPCNFYELSWAKPDTSLTDTLVGYNIYRNNVLYRFQTFIGANHTFNQDTLFGGEAFVYSFSPPFYIHVTAVYNSNHIESIYNDSALCEGGFVGINDKADENITFYPNPIKDNSVIHINFPGRKIEYISIISLSGQLITKTFLESNEANISVRDLNLKNDLYILFVYGDNLCVSKEFIKTD